MAVAASETTARSRPRSLPRLKHMPMMNHLQKRIAQKYIKCVPFGCLNGRGACSAAFDRIVRSMQDAWIKTRTIRNDMEFLHTADWQIGTQFVPVFAGRSGASGRGAFRNGQADRGTGGRASGRRGTRCGRYIRSADGIGHSHPQVVRGAGRVRRAVVHAALQSRCSMRR